MDPTPYLQKHARKLDLYLYEYLFKGANAELVLGELATYQNTDGGFGKGLEPDLQLPASSVLATTVAFQYLSHLDVQPSHRLIQSGLRYLLQAYNNAKNGWINIPPAADKFPRAPWWDYKSLSSWAEWGNPSAEVLGYLLTYADQVRDDALLQRLSKQAVARLQEITEPEQHEVKCYIRLYRAAGKELRQQLHEPLARCIKQATTTDSKRWEGYVAAPLSFVAAPDDLFADLFDPQLLLENAQFIRQHVVDGDHWEPTWEWGRFEAEWAKAKVDWSGKLTVENIQLLKAFGL
jgi:hypothetical protein